MKTADVGEEPLEKKNAQSHRFHYFCLIEKIYLLLGRVIVLFLSAHSKSGTVTLWGKNGVTNTYWNYLLHNDVKED